MRWAVLAGGAGTNLKAILASGLRVSLVISHRAGVGALAIAHEYGVPSRVVLARDFPRDREAYDEALRQHLAEFAIDRVAMAGFLRWLTETTIKAYPGAIFNLHPSLLPAYPGLQAIERAYADRVLWTGVTVHFVDEGHDTGPVIAQMPIRRHMNDSLHALTERVHRAEHALYPCVLRAINQGMVFLQDGQVHWTEEAQTWMHGLSSV